MTFTIKNIVKIIFGEASSKLLQSTILSYNFLNHQFYFNNSQNIYIKKTYMTKLSYLIYLIILIYLKRKSKKKLMNVNNIKKKLAYTYIISSPPPFILKYPPFSCFFFCFKENK